MMIRSVVVVQQCQVSPVGSGKNPVARILETTAAWSLPRKRTSYAE